MLSGSFLSKSRIYRMFTFGLCRLQKAKMPKISKEMILFTLHRYRDLDLHIQKNKERLIDGLVKAIYLYDDKLVFYLTYTDDPVTIPTAEELEAMEHSSDVNALSSPKKTPPNRGGFSFAVRESKGGFENMSGFEGKSCQIPCNTACCVI